MADIRLDLFSGHWIDVEPGTPRLSEKAAVLQGGVEGPAEYFDTFLRHIGRRCEGSAYHRNECHELRNSKLVGICPDEIVQERHIRQLGVFRLADLQEHVETPGAASGD